MEPVILVHGSALRTRYPTVPGDIDIIVVQFGFGSCSEKLRMAREHAQAWCEKKGWGRLPVDLTSQTIWLNRRTREPERRSIQVTVPTGFSRRDPGELYEQISGPFHPVEIVEGGLLTSKIRGFGEDPPTLAEVLSAYDGMIYSPPWKDGYSSKWTEVTPSALAKAIKHCRCWGHPLLPQQRVRDLEDIANGRVTPGRWYFDAHGGMSYGGEH